METPVSKQKATWWAFTAYEDQWHYFQDDEKKPKLPQSPIKKWGWQPEKCKDTGRPHLQGWIQCQDQVRGRQIMDLIPGVHIEAAKKTIALLNYCQKEETKDGEYVEATNKERIYRPEELLIWIASLRDTSYDSSGERAFENGEWEKWVKARNRREFKSGVKAILRQNIKLTTVFMNVAYEKMYIDYRDVYTEKAEEAERKSSSLEVDEKNKNQTDRQTDADDALAAFLDDGALRQKYGVRSDL